MSLRRAAATLRSFRADTRGVAAIEFAFLAMFLIVSVLNAFDVGRYAYQRLQVFEAAYTGAQAAWKTCSNATMLPATQNCSGLSGAVTTAIHSTSLGAAVSLSPGLAEGYYCVNAANALQLVGSVSNRPADCSAAGNANAAPGDYLQVSVTFRYAPLFPGMTVMRALGVANIAKTSWMRLG